MSIKLATHRYRNRHGTFNFRLVPPQDLRGQVQQREFRFRLYSEQRHQTIISATRLVADLPHLLSNLRGMADDEKPVFGDAEVFLSAQYHADKNPAWMKAAAEKAASPALGLAALNALKLGERNGVTFGKKMRLSGSRKGLLALVDNARDCWFEMIS